MFQLRKKKKENCEWNDELYFKSWGRKYINTEKREGWSDSKSSLGTIERVDNIGVGWLNIWILDFSSSTWWQVLWYSHGSECPSWSREDGYWRWKPEPKRTGLSFRCSCDFGWRPKLEPKICISKERVTQSDKEGEKVAWPHKKEEGLSE